MRPAAPRVWAERPAQAGQVATEVDFVAAARQGIPDLRAHQAKQEALARVGRRALYEMRPKWVIAQGTWLGVRDGIRNWVVTAA